MIKIIQDQDTSTNRSQICLGHSRTEITLSITNIQKSLRCIHSTNQVHIATVIYCIHIETFTC